MIGAEIGAEVGTASAFGALCAPIISIMGFMAAIIEGSLVISSGFESRDERMSPPTFGVSLFSEDDGFVEASRGGDEPPMALIISER